MKKTLILARHGKAEKAGIGSLDFKRNLIERGESDVQRVSEELKKLISPQQIVSSTANRAFQTAKIFAKTFEINKKDIQLEESIYEASMSALLKVINKLDDQYGCILLTGHNPAFEYAVEYWSAININHLPTSGTAIIEFPFEKWEMISEGTGNLIKIIEP